MIYKFEKYLQEVECEYFEYADKVFMTVPEDEVFSVQKSTVEPYIQSDGKLVLQYSTLCDLMQKQLGKYPDFEPISVKMKVFTYTNSDSDTNISYNDRTTDFTYTVYLRQKDW